MKINEIKILEDELKKSKISSSVYCDIYKCSRIQRINEIRRGQGYAGTNGYESKGCYRCKGINQDCIESGHYTTFLKGKM